MKYNKLTPEEEDVIVNKGTEPPRSGEYDQFSREGIFTCRRCNAPLYRSEDKFDAHCGWPSFDDEIPGAVKRTRDADGSRTEITCERCDAHLGHIFLGEKATPKDTRHCVNSLSMKFVPKKEAEKMRETAYFGSGCFWCAEAIFRRLKGVLSVTPGYTGGDKENPSYEEVSNKETGHAEAVRIEFDPTRISYEALLTVFFGTHDPTTKDRQGGDVGPQYRSIILYADENQREIADKYIAKLEEEEVFSAPIVTELRKFEKFYEAEDYHKDYFENNPNQPYCQAVISPKVAKLREKFKKWMKEEEKNEN